jgi:hypothetical protein
MRLPGLIFTILGISLSGAMAPGSTTAATLAAGDASHALPDYRKPRKLALAVLARKTLRAVGAVAFSNPCPTMNGRRMTS